MTAGITSGNNRASTGASDMHENSSSGEIGPGLAAIPWSGATHTGVQGFNVAGNGAVNFIGITARTTWPASLLDGETNNLTDADGFPLTDVDMAQVSEMTPLLRRCVCRVVYASGTAVGYGGKLQTAPNGQVTAYSDASGAGDPSAIIGECRVVGGMGTSGGEGLAYIY